MLALPIFPGSHPPSIVGANELNFCVRDGNRWTLTAINTNDPPAGFPASFFIIARLFDLSSAFFAFWKDYSEAASFSMICSAYRTVSIASFA